MRIESFDRAADFLVAAEPVFLMNEARTSLMFGIVRRLNEGGRFGDDPPILLGAMHGGHLVALITRTPPYNLLVHVVNAKRFAMSSLISFLRERDPDLPGVHAERHVARAFAEAWAKERGRPAHVRMEQRLYRLDDVAAIESAPGRFRLADPSDRETLASWVHAFMREATPDDPHPDPGVIVDRHIQARTLALWDDGGPVSIAGSSRATPHGASVSLVYTPPAKRGRGYASSCVAELSRRQLQSGKAFCTLFADLANSTSNAIYQRIGYRSVADFTMIEFAG